MGRTVVDPDQDACFPSADYPACLPRKLTVENFFCFFIFFGVFGLLGGDAVVRRDLQWVATMPQAQVRLR